MAENLVSWQTAFWSLVPIALNTMLQPSGRVCGLDPELHTYLTSSPLVCAFDSIVILVRFLTSWEYFRSFRFAIHDTLEERFPSPAQPTSGLRALESATFIRWLGFIVGTLPQFIKLQALTGVPWTQAWAWMYLINFSLVETLSFLDNIIGPPSPPARQEPPNPSYPDLLYPDLIGYRLPTFNRVCGFLALASHFFLVEWTGKSLVALDSEPFQWSAGTIVLFVTVACMAIGAYFVYRYCIRDRISIRARHYPIILRPYTYYFVTAPVNIGIIILFVVLIAKKDKSATTIYWFSKTTEWGMPVLPVIQFMQYAAALLSWPTWRVWRESILLLPVEEAKEVEVNEAEMPEAAKKAMRAFEADAFVTRVLRASYALLMFIGSFTLAIFWYAFCFNSEGTVKPDWTNMFG